MAFPIALMMSVTAEWSYYVGMIFIGISWNLAFTGGRYFVLLYWIVFVFYPLFAVPYALGTMLLSLSYSFREKAGAQAMNDVCVFGISSFVALMSGLVSADFTWLTNTHTLIDYL